MGTNRLLVSNINTTTDKSDLESKLDLEKMDFPESWLNINLEPLRAINFSLTQLKQLHSKSLNTPEIIQESVNHFAFGLENNPKVKQYPEPLNVLMGVLRKGQAWVEQGYRSPSNSRRHWFREQACLIKHHFPKIIGLMQKAMNFRQAKLLNNVSNFLAEYTNPKCYA